MNEYKHAHALSQISVAGAGSLGRIDPLSSISLKADSA